MKRISLRLTALALISAASLAACTPESPPLDPPEFTCGTATEAAETKDDKPEKPEDDHVQTSAAETSEDTSDTQETPQPEDSGSTQKTKDRWYRRYRHTGGERDAGYEDYILVEYNQKDNYVSMQMMFIGVNAYMSVDSSGLVPQDGEYWIQDFMNADGSEPELTKVYLKYSDSAIVLYYWNDSEKKFDFEHGQHFEFEEEF